MLTGAKTVLRAPVDGDLAFLVALRNDIETQMFLMSLPRANTPQRVTEWIANTLNDAETVFFIVAEKKTDQPIGYVQLRHMDFINGVGELGICLQSEAHGKGHAKESLELLEAYARDVFNLRKVVLRVTASNTRATTFYAKTGYATVGTHRQHFYQRGAYHDVTIMEKFLTSSAEDQG